MKCSFLNCAYLSESRRQKNRKWFLFKLCRISTSWFKLHEYIPWQELPIVRRFWDCGFLHAEECQLPLSWDQKCTRVYIMPWGSWKEEFVPLTNEIVNFSLRPNPHWTWGQQFVGNSFDAACVLCENHHSQQQVPFACFCVPCVQCGLGLIFPLILWARGVDFRGINRSFAPPGWDKSKEGNLGGEI